MPASPLVGSLARHRKEGGAIATKKQGVLTAATEWWRHLRPFQKRKFWKRHRKAERRLVDRGNDEE